MSAWKDFVTTALLGTEKIAVAKMPAVPAPLESALASAGKLEREAQFLTRAGAFALWRRAGWKAPQSHAPPAPAALLEADPILSHYSAAHLRAMLGGRCAEVLPEWLREAARLGRRLPPELLPALLDRARQNRALRPLAMAAGGARIRWLAAQNPDWNFAADDSPEHWETGHRDQRLAILRGWRAANSAQAREKLEAVWSAEPADARAAFLGAFADDLSNEDAPFLERALDDRSKEVRATAVDLLGRLPDSPFVARMIARADALLSFKPGGLLKRASLEVELPDSPDAAAKRDGLNPKTLPASRELGEKATLLAHILAAVPLRHWTDRFQQTPEALLKAAKRSDFADALISGWSLALTQQRDAAWARAMLADGPLLIDKTLIRHMHLVGNVGTEIFDALPVSERIDRLLAAVRAEPLKITASDFSANFTGWAGFFFHFADSSPDYLPEELARKVLDEARRAAVSETRNSSYFLRNFVESLALKVPPPLLPEAIEGWPIDKDGVPDLLALLAFRHDALSALPNPE
jgi:hypothetical protein